MKKIISITLLISILLSFAFNVSAAPYYDDISAKAGMLAKLGIIDEITNEAELNKEVTRRDFIIAAAKMLGINIYEVNPNRYYKDMTEDDLAWNAVGVLLEMNILTMNDSHTFRPNDVVTRDEALCVLAKILGVTGVDYETTLAIAKRSDVSDGVTDTRLKLSDAITLFHNALSTPMYKYVGADSNNFKSEQGTETMMEVYFDLYHVEGIVNSVNDTSISDVNGYGEKTICIGDTVINAQLSDPYVYLGCYASAYYTDTDGRYELKYISLRNNRTDSTVIDIEDFVGFDIGSYVVKYYDGDKVKTVSLDKGVNVIKNGENVSKNVAAVFDNIVNGEIILINADNIGACETMIVNTYENIVVQYTDTVNKIIYGRDGKVIDLSDTGKTNIITTATGEAIALSDIAKDNIISCYTSGKLNRLVVSNNTITGEIVSVVKRNGKTVITIGQNEYMADKVFADANPDFIKVGMTVTAYIDAYDKAADLVLDRRNGGIYAYVIDYRVEEMFGETVYLKLFTENNETVTLPLAENVKIDGEKCTTAKAVEKAMLAAKGKVDGQIAIVDINSDNEIRSIDTSAEGSLQNGLFVSSPESEYYFYSGQMLLGPLAQINSSSKLFLVPQSAQYKDEEDAYMVVKGNSFFKDWEKYKIEGYRTGNPSTVGYTEAMLLKTDIVGTDGFVTSPINVFIISDISEVYDEATQTIKEQITLLSGRAETAYVNADNYSFNSDSQVKVGNAVKIKTNSKGEVASVTLLYGEKKDGTKVIGSNNTVALTGWGTKDTYAVGYVSSMNDGLIGISMESGGAPFLIMPSGKAVAVYDPSMSDKVYSGGENDLIEAMNKGYKVVVDISRGSVRSYSVIKVNY